MKRQTAFYRDIWQAFSHSKGRFISILCLMMLGSFSLVGLKATPRDVSQTTSQYMENLQGQDLTLIADYGLSTEDQADLQAIPRAQVEFGYMTDAVVNETPQAWRILSLPKTLGQYQLVEGRLPEEQGEIALLSHLASQFRLGDQVQLSEPGRNRTLLSSQTFTVTGFVNSTELGGKTLFGSSTVGSGRLDGYGVVTEAEFQGIDYLLARIRFDDLAGLDMFAHDYQTKLADHQASIEALLRDKGARRLASLQSSGQEEIDSGEAALQEAQSSLDAGASQLSSAREAWSEQARQLNQVQAELASQDETLSSGQNQLALAHEALAIAKVQLEQGASRLASARQELATNQVALDEREGQLNQAKETLEAKARELSEGRQALETGQAQLGQVQADLASREAILRAQGQEPEEDPAILVAREQLVSQEAELAQETSQLSLAQERWDQGQDQYQEGLQQYEAGRTALNQAQRQIDQEASRYQEALSQYQAGLAAYEVQAQRLAEGKTALEAGQATLASGQAGLEEAKRAIDQEEAEFQRLSQEAQASLQEGQAHLDEARDNLAHLRRPSYRLYSRLSLPGGALSAMNIQVRGIANVGNLFPIVLYLVAAFVTLTTMTRFVYEERLNIGILKALGYGNRQIGRKFFLYGFLASGIGAWIGILAGMYLLPYILGRTLFASTTYPPAQLHFYWDLAGLSWGISLVASLVPTYWATQQSLQESTAQLLLPKPPSKGARILLERLTFIWRYLTFTQKVTARNIFRYKQRMLMTIVGVAGSVTLLFAGLGLVSSLSGIEERQFNQLLGYDLLAVQGQDLRAQERLDLEAKLTDDQIQAQQVVGLTSYAQDLGKEARKQNLTLLVSRGGDFGGFIQLLDSETQEKLALTDDGVIITRKLANLAKVGVGGIFQLQGEDGQTYPLRVAGIAEMYAGHYLYMQASYYERVFGQPVVTNAHLIRLKEPSPARIEALAASFMELNGIQSVIQNLGVRQEIKQSVDSLQLVMQILVLVSVSLAAVILYNLTTINVAERMRELSTIKVLGFHHQEVTLYIYRETLLLSLVGVGVGLMAGRTLHLLLLDQVAGDQFLFNPQVSVATWLVPIGAILFLTLALGIYVHYRLKQVDMLAALKSVD